MVPRDHKQKFVGPQFVPRHVSPVALLICYEPPVVSHHAFSRYCLKKGISIKFRAAKVQRLLQYLSESQEKKWRKKYKSKFWCRNFHIVFVFELFADSYRVFLAVYSLPVEQFRRWAFQYLILVFDCRNYVEIAINMKNYGVNCCSNLNH